MAELSSSFHSYYAKERVIDLENKTLRYKGHWEWMKAYRELGLFSREVVDHNGREIVPRHFYHQLLEKKLDHGRVEDVCLMRIKAIGFKDSKKYGDKVIKHLQKMEVMVYNDNVVMTNNMHSKFSNDWEGDTAFREDMALSLIHI